MGWRDRDRAGGRGQAGSEPHPERPDMVPSATLPSRHGGQTSPDSPAASLQLLPNPRQAEWIPQPPACPTAPVLPYNSQPLFVPRFSSLPKFAPTPPLCCNPFYCLACMPQFPSSQTLAGDSGSLTLYYSFGVTDSNGLPPGFPCNPHLPLNNPTCAQLVVPNQTFPDLVRPIIIEQTWDRTETFPDQTQTFPIGEQFSFGSFLGVLGWLPAWTFLEHYCWLQWLVDYSQTDNFVTQFPLPTQTY